jgi:hypothetical protein
VAVVEQLQAEVVAEPQAAPKEAAVNNKEAAVQQVVQQAHK